VNHYPIQFTAPDKALGVANRELAVIDSIAPDGRVAAHLESGREISFDPTEHRHFDHGYAVTSHSAQGLYRLCAHGEVPAYPPYLVDTIAATLAI
jgi:ATP-dependent exoDNAse (exonuclease V) alpha subunit